MAARTALTDGEPIVMLNYTRPDIGHITSIKAVATRAGVQFLPSEAPAETGHACQQERPQHGSQPSDLCSVEGDQCAQLHDTALTSNMLFRGTASSQEPLAPQPGLAWQGNPEFSPGTEGATRVGTVSSGGGGLC
jgi:hypothetical protein